MLHIPTKKVGKAKAIDDMLAEQQKEVLRGDKRRGEICIRLLANRERQPSYAEILFLRPSTANDGMPEESHDSDAVTPTMSTAPGGRAAIATNPDSEKCGSIFRSGVIPASLIRLRAPGRQSESQPPCSGQLEALLVPRDLGNLLSHVPSERKSVLCLLTVTLCSNIWACVYRVAGMAVLIAYRRQQKTLYLNFTITRRQPGDRLARRKEGPQGQKNRKPTASAQRSSSQLRYPP